MINGDSVVLLSWEIIIRLRNEFEFFKITSCKPSLAKITGFVQIWIKSVVLVVALALYLQLHNKNWQNWQKCVKKPHLSGVENLLIFLSAELVFRKFVTLLVLGELTVPQYLEWRLSVFVDVETS